MFTAIRNIIAGKSANGQESSADLVQKKHMAAGVLLLEAAHVDHECTEEEMERLEEITADIEQANNQTRNTQKEIDNIQSQIDEEKEAPDQEALDNLEKELENKKKNLLINEKTRRNILAYMTGIIETIRARLVEPATRIQALERGRQARKEAEARWETQRIMDAGEGALEDEREREEVEEREPEE